MNRFTTLMMSKVRGIRVLDIAAAGCLMLIVLVVYWSKAGAGAEAAKIADTNRQIATEEDQLRLLRAQHAYLTRPERLRTLSEQYLAMSPVKPTHEMTPETIQLIRQSTLTAPQLPSATAPAAAPEPVR